MMLDNVADDSFKKQRNFSVADGKIKLLLREVAKY